MKVLYRGFHECESGATEIKVNGASIKGLGTLNGA